MWFIIFRTLAKISEVAGLCLMLPKYYKTFDSLLYLQDNNKYIKIIDSFTLTFFVGGTGEGLSLTLTSLLSVVVIYITSVLQILQSHTTYRLHP